MQLLGYPFWETASTSLASVAAATWSSAYWWSCYRTNPGGAWSSIGACDKPTWLVMNIWIKAFIIQHDSSSEICTNHTEDRRTSIQNTSSLCKKTGAGHDPKVTAPMGDRMGLDDIAIVHILAIRDTLYGLKNISSWEIPGNKKTCH